MRGDCSLVECSELNIVYLPRLGGGVKHSSTQARTALLTHLLRRGDPSETGGPCGLSAQTSPRTGGLLAAIGRHHHRALNLPTYVGIVLLSGSTRTHQF
jgi:hypothetical protein